LDRWPERLRERRYQLMEDRCAIHAPQRVSQPDTLTGHPRYERQHTWHCRPPRLGILPQHDDFWRQGHLGKHRQSGTRRAPGPDRSLKRGSNFIDTDTLRARREHVFIATKHADQPALNQYWRLTPITRCRWQFAREAEVAIGNRPHHGVAPAHPKPRIHCKAALTKAISSLKLIPAPELCHS
jgi:hypothetical protein